MSAMPLARFSRHPLLLLLSALAACGTEGTLEVTNLTPLPVDVAIRYPGNRDSVITQGWYRLNAGESRTFARKFRGIQPEFAVYGHTAGSPQLTRWLHGQGDDTSGRRYFSGNVPGPVTTAGFHIRGRAEDAQGPATRTARFAAVAAMDERGRAHRVVLKDQRFAAVYQAAAQAGSDDPVRAAAERMETLAGALHHQHWFARTFKDPQREYPFALAGLEDANGPLLPGVNIKLAPQTTIWGDAYPLKAGDELLSLDGHPIHGPEDLLSVLWDHATDTLSGGIREPMAFTVRRGGEEVSGRTTYFFNEEHFLPSAQEARRATMVGGFDSFTLGFSCQLGSIFGREFSRRRRAWNCQQEKARLQQQYRKNYVTGEMLSILIPIAAPIAGVKAARGAGRVRSARALTAGGAAYAGARAIVSTTNRGSPLQGPGDVLAEAGIDMAIELGVQEVFAVNLNDGS